MIFLKFVSTLIGFCYAVTAAVSWMLTISCLWLPNYPELVKAAPNSSEQQYLQPKPTKPWKCTSLKTPRSFLFIYFLYYTWIFEALLDKQIHGVAIIAMAQYGPTYDKRILQLLRQATEKGIVMLNVTQCPKGRVNVRLCYRPCTGRGGVLDGHDMTLEAGLTKLFFLFSRNYRVSTTISATQKNLRGEMTKTEL